MQKTDQVIEAMKSGQVLIASNAETPFIRLKDRSKMGSNVVEAEVLNALLDSGKIVVAFKCPVRGANYLTDTYYKLAA